MKDTQLPGLLSLILADSLPWPSVVWITADFVSIGTDTRANRSGFVFWGPDHVQRGNSELPWQL